MTLRRARVLTLVSLIGVAALAACSRPADSARSPAVVPVAGQGKTAPPGRPLAEALGANPRILVQVLEITRTGPEVVTVKFRLVNPDAAAPVRVRDETIQGVFLVDEAHQKQFFVMRDAQDRAQCTAGLGEIRPGGRAEAWSRFPAPAEGVERVTVRVPGVPPFRDLPIAAGGTGPAGPSY